MSESQETKNSEDLSQQPQQQQQQQQPVPLKENGQQIANNISKTSSVTTVATVASCDNEEEMEVEEEGAEEEGEEGEAVPTDEERLEKVAPVPPNPLKSENSLDNSSSTGVMAGATSVVIDPETQVTYVTPSLANASAENLTCPSVDITSSSVVSIGGGDKPGKQILANARVIESADNSKNSSSSNNNNKNNEVVVDTKIVTESVTTKLPAKMAILDSSESSVTATATAADSSSGNSVILNQVTSDDSTTGGTTPAEVAPAVHSSHGDHESSPPPPPQQQTPLPRQQKQQQQQQQPAESSSPDNNNNNNNNISSSGNDGNSPDDSSTLNSKDGATTNQTASPDAVPRSGKQCEHQSMASGATSTATSTTTTTFSSCSTGSPPLTNNNSNNSGYNSTNTPGAQHVVLVHIQPGEIFAVRVGDQVQHISGPATVRMVSNSGPPLPMPMQVAPGHMVQQIVDEHGILTNVILAPQMPGMAPGSPMTGGPNNAAQYYSPFNSHYQTQPHPQYNPPHHHGHHAGPAHLHPGVPSSPHMHGPPPSHSCNNLTPSVLPTGPSPPLNSEERIRQRSWYKKCRKTEEGNYYRQPPRRNKNNKTNNNSVNISVNGDIHHQNNMANTPTAASTTENGAELEVERKFFQQMSNIPEPKVKEVEPRSASLIMAPPDFDQSEFEMSTVHVELQLSEKGRDKYRTVYSGPFQEITLKNLKPATEYSLRACSRFEELKGSMTEPVIFKTLCCVPDQPQHPKLANKTKNSLLLKWNAACENGSKISTYSLEYDKGLNNGEFYEVYSGLVKQHRINYLQAGTKYTFRLAAINSIGKSLFSELTSYCTSGTVPPQPDPPTITTSQINSLNLSWVKRQSDETFTLQMEDETTGHGFLVVYNGPNCSYKVPNLQRNTDYRFRLSAKNEEGPSKWSEIVTYQTLPGPPGIPSKVQVKGKIHAHHFKVTWDPPKDTGGTKVFNYHVEMDDGEGFRNIYNGAELECSCDGLIPGSTYNVHVACSGPGGKSDFSDSISVTTPAVIPGQSQPPKLQGKPKATSLHLRWGPPVSDGGSPITEYIVQMVSPDNTTREVYKGRDTDCVVAGLLPGRPYLFQVKCSNKIGAGPWSESCEVVSGPGVPDAPKCPTVNWKSPHCIQLSWEKPVNNGATITDYRLEWQQKTNLDFTQLYVGPQRKYEIKNLLPATNYSFKVSAINSAGAGPFSSVCRCQTQPSSPAAVVHCKVQTTATDALLKWEEPHNNGSEILSYNIDTGDKQLINITDATEYRLEHLSPDTVYRIKIQAVNAIGPGAFSFAIKVITKSLPPEPPSLECVSAAPNSLKLKWGDGRNPDLIQYQLEIGRDDKHFQTVYYGSAHVYKVNRLSELTSYDFRIFAINDAGCGEYSNLFKFSTTKAPPPPLRAPKVSEITVNSCQVEWQGCKSMGADSVIYQLQILCISRGEHEYKSVYRGTETSFNVQNL
ncbi:fibronectin type-III domain-containing protein 3A, partial [Octopus bimaculoides]